MGIILLPFEAKRNSGPVGKTRLRIVPLSPLDDLEEGKR
jgi:hypothetical protein